MRSSNTIKKRPSKNNHGTQSKRPRNISSNLALIEPHPRFPGVFIGRNREDYLLTKNLVAGDSVYNEKRVLRTTKSGSEEFREWNCFRSKLAAGIVCGLDKIWIEKGVSVLYLGAANGTTISHVSEIVGIDTLVYGVEFSKRSGSDLVLLSTKRRNIVPIIADARKPHDYQIIVPMVDVIFSDISQPDQTKIVMDNAKYFLKTGGKIIISIKAPCVDSTIPAEQVFENESNWLRKHEMKLKEMVSIEPYERHHAIITGTYRPENRNTYQ